MFLTIVHLAFYEQNVVAVRIERNIYKDVEYTHLQLSVFQPHGRGVINEEDSIVTGQNPTQFVLVGGEKRVWYCLKCEFES